MRHRHSAPTTKSLSGRLIRPNIPCPVCGSSDAGAIYKNIGTDGEPFYMFQCFSLNHENGERYSRTISDPNNYEEELLTMTTKTPTPATTTTSNNSVYGLVASGKIEPLTNKNDVWGDRRIDAETCKYYGVSINRDCPLTMNTRKIIELQSQNMPTRGPGLIMPYYDNNGVLVAQKIRTSVNPKGYWVKVDDTAKGRVGFFGQQLFRANGLKEIVITFGELDALATFQMTGVNAISVSDGDGSAKVLFQKEYSFLNRFERIVIVPDNDDSCRAVIPLLGAIFPRKIRIVNLTKHKDPNDYLKAGDSALFREELYAAQPYNPEKIISLSNLRNLIFEDPPIPVAQYPWQGLNEKTGGVWAGELVTVKAPPKIGKSTLFSEIAYHLKTTTDYPIGLIYLEETPRDLIYRFATMQLNKNLQRADIRESVSIDELTECVDTLLKDDKVFLVDHFGSCSSDFLEEKIQEFVLAKGCQFIFFDHISMAITDESNRDERIALDRLIAAIKALTVGIPDEEIVIEVDPKTGKEEQVRKMVLRQPTIFMVTHVNDNGQPRGSRAALQLSNLVIGLERDKMSQDRNARNLTRVIVEENRRLGENGLACVLKYDSATGRLTEIPMANDDGEETEG